MFLYFYFSASFVSRRSSTIRLRPLRRRIRDSTPTRVAPSASRGSLTNGGQTTQQQQQPQQQKQLQNDHLTSLRFQSTVNARCTSCFLKIQIWSF